MHVYEYDLPRSELVPGELPLPDVMKEVPECAE